MIPLIDLPSNLTIHVAQQPPARNNNNTRANLLTLDAQPRGQVIAPVAPQAPLPLRAPNLEVAPLALHSLVLYPAGPIRNAQHPILLGGHWPADYFPGFWDGLEMTANGALYGAGGVLIYRVSELLRPERDGVGYYAAQFVAGTVVIWSAAFFIFGLRSICEAARRR